MNHPSSRSLGRRSTSTMSIMSVARFRMAACVAALIGAATSVTMIASCTVDEQSPPRGKAGFGTGGADSVSGSGGEEDAGGPCVEGATRECHITIGENNGVLTCLNGTRTCASGVWGPCVGEFASHVMPGSQLAGNVRPGQSVAFGLSDAGACVNNPCDPSCQAFDELPAADAGYEVVPEVQTVWLTGNFDELLSTLPPGFANKGLKNPCTTISDCQFDSHCLPSGTNGIACEDGAAKCCMAWNPGEYNTACSLPDVSPGLACIKPDGTKIIPLCNRGNAPLVSPIRIYIFPGDSNQFPTCIPDKNEEICDIPAGVTIQPGQCYEATNCGASLPGMGVRSIMINGPLMAPGTAPDNPYWKDECSCQNNWTVWKGAKDSPCKPVQMYQADPIVKNQVYQGICPAGTRVQWGFLAWNTTTPSDSNVVFEMRSALTNAGLAAATYVNMGTAKALPTPNTQICSAAGPAPCPKNIFTALGGAPAGHNEFLELQITINPSTDQKFGAEVNNWQITYSCPPTQ